MTKSPHNGTVELLNKTMSKVVVPSPTSYYSQNKASRHEKLEEIGFGLESQMLQGNSRGKIIKS